MYRKELLDLGIPANINGFEYLNYALQLYQPGMPMMKEVYQKVAKQFNTTFGQAERSMRYAIKTSGEKITVGKFIAKYKILWK